MHKRIILAIIILLFSIEITKADTTQAQPTLPDLSMRVNQYSEKVPYDVYSKWTSPIIETGISNEYRSEIENITNCPAAKPLACDLFLSLKQRMHFKLKTINTVNKELVRKYLQELAKKSDTEPINATFAITDGRATAFTAEQPGIKLNIENSIDQISETLEKKQISKDSETIMLSYDTIDPAVTASEINNLGVATLIGEGKSNFKGSPVNRIYNIKTAVSRFNGVLLKPNEEFSFVKLLGDVDAEHGYRPELVIKNNKTEPEFGGGICQVSTTVFRAAIFSGLQITARSNHAYPVSYYDPQGMDSTIYIPKPDLKFINNTPGTILIQPKINGTELIFDFYGTDDGRKIEVDGPRITESNPDKSIKTVFTQKVTDANGNIFINDTFKSAYQSPYKYPHLGSPLLSVKPSNWSEDEWNAYKQAWKEANPAPTKKKKG